ncbi:MAG: hypothetical protein KKB34_04865 [Bacteroidetes bacterium]|nr:hypothetical protein [Bacteroidota bacterium]
MKNLLTLITLAIIVFTGVNNNNNNNSILLTDLTDKSNQSFFINQYADDHLLKNSVNFSGFNVFTINYESQNHINNYVNDNQVEKFSEIINKTHLTGVVAEIESNSLNQFSKYAFVN